MNRLIHAWQQWPDANELLACWQQHQQQHPHRALGLLIIDDDGPQRPITHTHAAAPEAWPQRLIEAFCYAQPGQPCVTFAQPLPNTTLWWMSTQMAMSMADDVLAAMHWHTPRMQGKATSDPKPWLAQAPTRLATHVVVVGAGIAGASTAYALASKGVAVTVLEAAAPAQAASGNRQGLLYAKIAAHHTAQTELLLAGYAYSRQLMDLTLSNSDAWQACGVLHLNHNATETRRNQQLAAQQSRLYQGVGAEQASELAGIRMEQGGLWWPYGAWVHPPAWVHALLQHPRIRLIDQAHVDDLTAHQAQWQVGYTRDGHQHTLAGSHVVLCAGAHSSLLPHVGCWPWAQIRGQTTTAEATAQVRQLRCALSAGSYISPAWQNQVCFGASFVPNDAHDGWRAEEQQHNWLALQQLHPMLAKALQQANPDAHLPHGHSAVRCDVYDHLPVVGSVGDAITMRHIYAHLALDKHARLTEPCPWLHGLYINTAHGSRGLATAPLCGEVLACQLLGLPVPLSLRLQHALHPNRMVIRSLTHHQGWPVQNPVQP